MQITEIDNLKLVLQGKVGELNTLKSEITQLQVIINQLVTKKKDLELELHSMRERHKIATADIESITESSEIKKAQSTEITTQTKKIEVDFRAQMKRFDAINMLIIEMASGLSEKEAMLAQFEGEIFQLKDQTGSIESQLKTLKALEAESRDGTDAEFMTASVKDLEGRIRAKEDQCIQMRKELEKAGYDSDKLIKSNSGLVVDINVMKDNIRVITVENAELAK